EGTRNSERLPQQFRPGLFRLATDYPHVELVPVYLDTLHRALPKGALLPLPLPLYCNVHFGAPLPRLPGEGRDAFLERARAAVEAMAGAHRPGCSGYSAASSPCWWWPPWSAGCCTGAAGTAAARRCATSTRGSARGGAWSRCWRR